MSSGHVEREFARFMVEFVSHSASRSRRDKFGRVVWGGSRGRGVKVAAAPVARRKDGLSLRLAVETIVATTVAVTIAALAIPYLH